MMIRFAACLLAGVAAAAEGQAPVAGGTLSLSDEQKAELLARDTEDSVATARSGLGGDHARRQIHGEIGAFVGSHGARGAYGAAAIPLGDNAQAAVSFESSRYGRPR